MPGGLDPRSRAALRRLSDLGKVIAGDAGSELERAAQTAARKTQEAILRAATHHPGDLRAEIAKTVSVTSRTGRDTVTVEIRSDGRKMPEGKSTLPGHANRGSWRHPVFGDMEIWRTQVWATGAGWFDSTLAKERDNLIAAAGRGVDRAARDVGNA